MATDCSSLDGRFYGQFSSADLKLLQFHSGSKVDEKEGCRAPEPSLDTKSRCYKLVLRAFNTTCAPHYAMCDCVASEWPCTVPASGTARFVANVRFCETNGTVEPAQSKLQDRRPQTKKKTPSVVAESRCTRVEPEFTCVCGYLREREQVHTCKTRLHMHVR
jgi:hypothetical protein